MTDLSVIGMLAEAVLSGDHEQAMKAGYAVMISPAFGAREGA